MKKAFTLIEVLVVIAILGVLMTISIFALNSARQNARDARRKADLEAIRAALEIYRSDCFSYPLAVTDQVPTPLIGDDISSSQCLSTNIYANSTPQDPSTGRIYRYARLTATRYELCASLEGQTTAVTCGGSSDCGTGFTCTYKVVSP